MTLGEKIKELRSVKGITQEVLAEELNVSRSAIAKGESNGGIPEIGNLREISKIFQISVDELIDDTKDVDTSYDKRKENFCISNVEVENTYYDIDLKGWNTGVYDIVIIQEDHDFLFYKRRVKNREVFGFLGKKYITNMSASKKVMNMQNTTSTIDRAYFCGKHVCIKLAYKEGFIKGFFDFKNDDYLDVIVRSFSESKIQLAFGREVKISEITKLEELES